MRMRNIIIFALLIFISNTVSADVLRCSFGKTEYTIVLPMQEYSYHYLTMEQPESEKLLPSKEMLSCCFGMAKVIGKYESFGIYRGRFNEVVWYPPDSPMKRIRWNSLDKTATYLNGDYKVDGKCE